MTESEDNPYLHEKLPPIESVLVPIDPDQVVWRHGWEAMTFRIPTQAARPTELNLRRIAHQHADLPMPNGHFVLIRDVLIPRNPDGSFTGDTWFTLDNHYPLDERSTKNTPPITTEADKRARNLRAHNAGWAD